MSPDIPVGAAARMRPNATTADGQEIRMLGEPFALNYPVPPGARLRCPPIVWVAALCADGKVRPFNAEGVRGIA